LDQLERSRSRSKSPEKAVGGQRPTSRSPSPPAGNRESKEQPVQSSFPARRFDQTQVRVPWTPPPVRSFRGVGTTNQNPTQNLNIPRGRVEDKVVGPVESWDVTACSIDGTTDRMTCHHPVWRAYSLLYDRSLTLHPVERALVMFVVDLGATPSSTMMMGLKRMGKIEVFPLSLHLPLRLPVVDRSRETTSGTRVRAPGLHRIRSARSIVRSSS